MDIELKKEEKDQKPQLSLEERRIRVLEYWRKKQSEPLPDIGEFMPPLRPLTKLKPSYFGDDEKESSDEDESSSEERDYRQRRKMALKKMKMLPPRPIIKEEKEDEENYLDDMGSDGLPSIPMKTTRPFSLQTDGKKFKSSVEEEPIAMLDNDGLLSESGEEENEEPIISEEKLREISEAPQFGKAFGEYATSKGLAVGSGLGGQQGAKYFFNPGYETNPPETGSGIIKRAHEGYGSAIKSKSYENFRKRQQMRHLSSFIRSYCKLGGEEVQCYYDTEGNRIYAAANTNKSIKSMKRKFTVTKEEDGEDVEKPIDNAEELHALIRGADMRKLAPSQRNRRRQIDKLKKKQKRFLKHFRDASFEIVPELDSALDGLHAERRIQKKLGEEYGEKRHLDHRTLGGIRRPCFVCHSMVHDEEGRESVRRGPLWESGAASLDLTVADKRRIVTEGLGATSYTSKMKEKGKISFGDDTESGTEYDDIDVSDDEEEEEDGD